MKRLWLVWGFGLLALGCDRSGSDAPMGRPETNSTTPAVTTDTGDTPAPVDVTAGEDMTARDNTGVNERDAGGSTVTPFDQSNEQADINLVAEIRSRVVDIDNLSVKGRNVKIVTNQGRVVLRGPVDSVEEREAIVKIAEDLAGTTNVNDQLEVDNN